MTGSGLITSIEVMSLPSGSGAKHLPVLRGNTTNDANNVHATMNHSPTRTFVGARSSSIASGPNPAGDGSCDVPDFKTKCRPEGEIYDGQKLGWTFPC